MFPCIVFAEHKANKYFSEQYYINTINHSQYVTWQLSNGEGSIVAVIDDGVWLQHPDLVGANWKNNKEIPNNDKDDDNNGYIDDCYGWNFLDNNNDLVSKGKHGTAVAGIIAARDNTIGIVGIAPKSKIMSLTVCDNYGCDDDAIYDAIIYAANNGADVISISLGSTNGYTGYNAGFDYAISYAYNRGVVIVVAAGNGDTESAGQTGMDLDFYKISPVNNNLVLGVGALDKTGQYRTNWSNYGNGVDIYAPGEEIISTIVPLYSNNYSYGYLDGTSFSAPMVAATAALLKSYSILSNVEIMSRITSKSNKGKLDIKNSLEGIDIKKRRDYVSSIPEETPQEEAKTNGSQEFDNQINKNIIEESNLNKEADKEAIKNIIAEEKNLITKIDNNLSKRMSGNILLQVEKNGEGWYVNPDDEKKYYLGRPADAFSIMRKLGLGATHEFITGNTIFPNHVLGKILLDVEQNGEAYYIYPKDKKAYYLGRPADAFNVMRNLGLGITNDDVRKIDVGEMN